MVDLPLWKMMDESSVGMMTFPTEWKNNPNVPNHQPEMIMMIMIILWSCFTYFTHLKCWDVRLLWDDFPNPNHDSNVAVCQNLVPLVNIKIAGKWMFIPLKMVLIGIDPYPCGISLSNVDFPWCSHLPPATPSQDFVTWMSAGTWEQPRWEHGWPIFA